MGTTTKEIELELQLPEDNVSESLPVCPHSYYSPSSPGTEPLCLTVLVVLCGPKLLVLDGQAKG